MLWVIVNALTAILAFSVKPVDIFDMVFGSLSLVFAVVLAFCEGQKSSKVKIVDEKDLEVGKVYKKKDEMFFDDRYIKWINKERGEVHGGQYITLLEDEEEELILVSFKKPAYVIFRVTGHLGDDRYCYLGEKVFV